jgi:cytidylate kinase
MNRSESPLKQADDAFVLDTTNLTEKEALDILISEFNKRK